MSELHLLYLIGAPGVGKSTLMAELVKGRRRQVRMKPFANTYYYEDGLVQLGRERGNGFSGTDVLAMDVQRRVVPVLEAQTWPRIVAEGDRLANGSFFKAVCAAGYRLDVVLLQASAETLIQRRIARGSNQNESWVRGRETKVANLSSYVTITLDATLPISKLGIMLKWHPVFVL